MTPLRQLLSDGKYLPNRLTLSRFVLAVLFAFLTCQNGLLPKIMAALVFLIASLTDFYDGYYAKKHSLISNFGKLMDPIADKFLILAAFFIFMHMHLIAVWMFVVIFLREAVITGMRLLAVRRGTVLAAETCGKCKTVLQIIAVHFILLFLIFKETALPHHWAVRVVHGWQYAIYVLMVLAVLLTLGSGIFYLWNNRRMIHAFGLR